jgi:hypothetical protein
MDANILEELAAFVFFHPENGDNKFEASVHVYHTVVSQHRTPYSQYHHCYSLKSHADLLT